MNGESRDVIASDFDLPGMDPGTYFDVERLEGIPDREGALNGATRAVEGRHEAVSGSVDLAAPEPSDLGAHTSVMTIEEISPGLVSEMRCPVGGADDVSEKDGGQDAFS